MWDHILGFLLGFIPTTTAVIYYLLARKWRRAAEHWETAQESWEIIADSWEHMYRAQRAENDDLRYERRVESMEMDRVSQENDMLRALLGKYQAAHIVLFNALGKAWWDGVTMQWEHRPVGIRILSTENPYAMGASDHG